MADTPASDHVPVGSVQAGCLYVVRDTPLAPCQVRHAAMAASASVKVRTFGTMLSTVVLLGIGAVGGGQVGAVVPVTVIKNLGRLRSSRPPAPGSAASVTR